MSLSPYQSQIHQTKYARWNSELARRETWEETVDRYVDFFSDRVTLPRAVWDRVRAGIVARDVVPSMRALMTAGPALEKDEVAGYNCSYLTISRPEAFGEIVYLLMCGVGVGFSVEEQYVAKLPIVPQEFERGDVIVVADSKYGWSDAVRKLVKGFYAGKQHGWDTSQVRPAGAILKTFGGRASGPAPLEDLMHHITQVFNESRGRRLTDVECHSIATKIGDIVVVGGVRRSAEISLFTSRSRNMLGAKQGEWWRDNPHFAMANNSAVFNGRPDWLGFVDTMSALVRSKAGEPGIFNRNAAIKQAQRTGRRDADQEFGTNPCGEIILRDRQLCNLSEVVVRPDDTLETLTAKVELAAIIGTVQSTLTKFRASYLSPQWRKNCEEERLLGVSLTGIYDHPVLAGRTGQAELEDWLDTLREHVVKTNAKYAKTLGIPASTATTCVKPSGNTSQLVGSASGIHPRHAKYAIRRNRGNKSDPVARFLVDSGVPHEDEVLHPDTTWVFSWPQRAPETAVVRADVSAIEQLELWLSYQNHWCEHKPSATITVREDEWPDVWGWVWKHWDVMSGVAFLPYDDHTYVQAPYEEVDEAQLVELEKRIPALDWSLLKNYEIDDRTEGHRELACVAGVCEI